MSIRTMASYLFIMALLIVLGCSRGPSRIYPPSIDAAAAGAKAIEQYDTDKDGKISGAELDRSPPLKAALANIDTSGKGVITAANIAARIQAWKNSKVGRISFPCTVLRNGRPLAGADVKFVPEKFLGDSIQTALGKTDQNGMAMLSVPLAGGDNLRGMAPGLYRVEITKAGQNIPPMYNVNTVLGQEVAKDANDIRRGVTFNLKY